MSSQDGKDDVNGDVQEQIGALEQLQSDVHDGAGQWSGDSTAPLPRAPKKRPRPRSERGLPPDDDLLHLAQIYLETQRSLWPELADTERLPQLTAEVLDAMIETYKERHRTGMTSIVPQNGWPPTVKSLGANYNRFSSDNSESKSIPDQMVPALHKAKEHRCFVPWEYVFSDYSVSGLHPARQGYKNVKTVLGDNAYGVGTVYISDFTRASRDEIEWWSLASFLRAKQKLLIGAEDNFRLDDPNADIMITVFNLVSRLFIRQLRQKVKRGMHGSVREGTCVIRPPLGFTRRPRTDKNGNVIRKSNGKPQTELCHDPHTYDLRREISDLFVNKNWSPYKIMSEFNRRKADNWDGWTEKNIRQLLWSPTAIGVFIWNQNSRVTELDENNEPKTVYRRRPRSEWGIDYRPDLTIVPPEEWKKGRKKLYATRQANTRTGKPKQNRTATTLFSGILYCSHCEEPLKLYRSSSKYQDLACLNGRRGAHGCELSTSKSTRIIEQSLLGYINQHLLTEEVVTDLVDRANEHLDEEARRPKEDLRPLQKEIDHLQRKIDKLVRLTEDDNDEEACKDYRDRVKVLRREKDKRQAELREKQATNADPPPQLDRERIEQYVADMRALLNQDIPASSQALWELTGPIKIHQEPFENGKKGARWVATFSPDLMNLLARVAGEHDYPDSVTLERLKTRNWTNDEPVAVTIQQTNVAERIADEVVAMLKAGTPREEAAEQFGVDPTTVDRAFHQFRPRPPAPTPDFPYQRLHHLSHLLQCDPPIFPP